MGDRISRSLKIAKDSYAVLKSNPSLVIFPVLSSIAVMLVSIPFLIPFALTAIASDRTGHHMVFGAVHYALTFGLYFANYFVIVFFNSALVACAHEELNGRRSSVAYGVETAMKRLPQIAGWALIASTVGTILKFIGERSGIIGTIVTSLVGMVWNLAVFFVVPALVLDRVGPIEAIKSSSMMIKQTWGERVVAGLGLGLITMWLMVLSLLPFGVGVSLLVSQSFVLGGIAICIGLVYVMAVALVTSSLTTIFQTALYLYVRTGQAPSGFQASSFETAFAVKPARSVFGRIF